MARDSKKPSLASDVPHTVEQFRVREQAKRIFGVEPETVDFRAPILGLRDACAVKLRVGGRVVDFTMAQGFLVGIFPRRPGH